MGGSKPPDTRKITRMTSHRSFILRMRNEEPDSRKAPRWRYVLLEPERQHRRSFISLDQLFAALVQEIGHGRVREQAPSEILCAVEDLLNTTSSETSL